MNTNVLQYLESANQRKPEKLAFSDLKVNLTFGDLYRQSRSVGSFLCHQGLSTQPVIIFMDKTPNTIATFFGVIYSGNYYVPIDSEMPNSRISLIFSTLNPKIVIVDDKTAEVAKTFCDESQIYHYNQISDTPVDEDALAAVRARSLDIDPIYIIFTSGSTGMPKGVMANHRSVIDYIENLSQVLSFNEDTVFGNQTPLYVDACLKELYPTLKFCATTYLIPKSLFMFPTKLVDYLNEQKINTICWVVSALTMISAFGTFKSKTIESLHTVAFGSEVFPIKQFNLWREHLPQAKFFNLYGPTEATGMSTYYPVERDFQEGDTIPIGRPFANTQILLLNEKNQLVTGDEPGEICIRGTCLTMGYYGDEEKTSQSFVQNPMVQNYRDLIYRTGDIGRYNDQGDLLFVSRKDYQIKHMGHRIELAEIEVAASTIEGIQMACCTYDNEHSRIYLHCVSTLTTPEILAQMKKLLPRYMVPYKVNLLEQMPLTPNGKIDRNLLRAQI